MYEPQALVMVDSMHRDLKMFLLSSRAKRIVSKASRTECLCGVGVGMSSQGLG